jgi:hypothetical protein
MSPNRPSNSALDLIGKVLFPRVRRSRRRTNLRFLLLSISLGLVVCGLLVLILWAVNRAGL